MPSRRRQQFQSTFRHLLALESLETRAMMAGNVTATVSKGTLLIKGDAEANEIIISQTSSAAGKYSITPISGSNTTINGGTAVVNLENVVRITIKMDAGNDKVGIGNDVELVNEIFDAMADLGDEEQGSSQASAEEADPEEDPEVSIWDFFGGDDDDDDGFNIEDPDFTPQQLAQLPTRVTGQTIVDLGDGDDTFLAIIRSNSNLNVDGGKGSDAILSMLSNVGNMGITADPSKGTGMASDVVAVVLTTVRGDLGITTEGGDDAVLVLGTKVTNFGVNAGGPATSALTDNDFVVISSLYAADNVGVQTEVGDDSIFVDDIVADTFKIVAGDGDDQVEISGAALLNLGIDTGVGEDWVSLTSGEGYDPNIIRRNLTINTGADDDQVEIEGGLLGMYVGGTMDVKTGAGNDSFLLYNVAVGKSVAIDMDTGNDTAVIDSFDVRNDLTITMGAGNDILSVHNLDADRYFVKGGTGNDTLHNLANHQGEFKHTLFENVDDGAA
ncbi:hypothetical protein [Anatilimnocola floriformis]|uniref:hypothetical protein n=1 Tax=Anatilimnocola floriformis TaxID=2948575 RepID=UPI0020C1CECB|nr:hypothetical protein [Anatilimnocola floriformis]